MPAFWIDHNVAFAGRLNGRRVSYFTLSQKFRRKCEREIRGRFRLPVDAGNIAEFLNISSTRLAT